MNAFKLGLLHAFLDLKLRQGFMARVDYKGNLGVTVTTGQGEKLFYSLENIIFEVYRVKFSPKGSFHA